jgi:lycopene cyclase domain-containing protein
MSAYAGVNAPFLVVGLALVVVAAVVTMRRALPSNARSRAVRRSALVRAGVGVLVSLVGVFVLTTVFDNVIILTGVVDYDHSLTSGIRIGVAPIEDYAYSLFAAVALPAVWLIVPARKKARR